MSSYKIIMTGGGSAGHVTPNLALLPKLKNKGYEVLYIGSKDGIEKEIIKKANIPYFEISCGKLRRYFDIKNFSDPFKVIKGIFDANKILKKEKPDVVFSKGGFVAVPVVISAYLNKIPVIAHESDLTPGLANKLSAPYCTKLCVTFPESIKHIKEDKGVLTGTPIREELLLGSREKGLSLCGFTQNRPVLLIIGGSLGSKYINDLVRNSLMELLKKYNVIHICGKGNFDENLAKLQGYKQFEYITEELPHIMKAADMVVSRAGANAIYEFLALRKPNLLIPLSKKSSRGDQILNAESFENSGYSMVVQEEDINSKNLEEKIDELYKNRNTYIKAMEESTVKNGVDKIIDIIINFSKK